MERRDFLLGSGFAVFAALGEARAANAMPARRWIQRQDDPLGGERLAGGTIRAPLLSFAQSSKPYDATR